MATIRCHKCQHDNPTGRGFCQECGTRLVLSSPVHLPPQAEPDSKPKPEPILPDPTEAERLKGLLAVSEQDAAELKLQLETEKRKAADALKDCEQHISEAARLKDSLEQSAQTVGSLQRDLEAEKSQSGRHGETVVALKQEHEGVLQKLTSGHQQLIAHKDTLIDNLKKNVTELERKAQTLVADDLKTGGSKPVETTVASAKRQFGLMAMFAIATLFAGAGGAGGYYYHGGADSGAPKAAQSASVGDLQNKLNASNRLNQELQDGLRSLHEAYDRLDQDLKTAQEQVRPLAPNPGGGSGDDAQRRLSEAETANKDLQQKLTDTQADLDQRKQQVTTEEQTIARLTQELQDAKSQEAKPRETKSQDTKEVKPRPRRSSDFESTIRNLEREYRRDVGAPWYPR
jgi:DNA repair exonuclease SbcCD ATPase subunit